MGSELEKLGCVRKPMRGVPGIPMQEEERARSLRMRQKEGVDSDPVLSREKHFLAVNTEVFGAQIHPRGRLKDHSVDESADHQEGQSQNQEEKGDRPHDPHVAKVAQGW